MLNKHIIQTLYFAIFNSHINYLNLIWGQNLYPLNRIIILKKKALKIMKFSLETPNQICYSDPVIF